MYLDDFIEVVMYVYDSFQKHQSQNNLVELGTLLSQSRQAQTQQLADNIQLSKNKILNGLNIIPNEWGLEKKKILEVLSLSDYLSEEGVNKLNNIFIKNQLNPVNLYTEYTKYNKIFTGVITNITNLRNSLLSIPRPSIKISTIPDDSGLLDIIFDKNALIKNLDDFENSIGEWKKVFTVYARVNNTTFESPAVYRVGNGSIIVGVLMSRLIIKEIVKTFNEITEAVGKIMQLEKIALEIEKQKIENQLLLQELDREKGKIIDSVNEKMIEQMMQNYNNGSNDSGEVKNWLNVSLKYLFKFARNGGCLHVKYKEEKEDIDVRKMENSFNEIESIRMQIEEIKKIDYKERQ